MGCCVSTNKPTPPHKGSCISKSKTTANHSGISKSPPPSHSLLLEEETVKEVLSETPAVAKTLSPKLRSRNASPFIKSAPLLQDKKQQNGGVRRKPHVEFAGDDASDASEILSTLSESVSASTSVTEKHNSDRKDEFRQRSPARLRNRRFSGEIHREKTVGRSPGRRSDPSPSRVRHAPAAGSVRRRENGESSGRRSTSPAMRVDSGLGGTQSVRKTGKSPGRVGPGSDDRIRKLNEGKEWPPTNASNESLENPLVSLECFIFL